MISEAAVRALAARTGDPAVATIYLDVDGRHRPVRADYEAAFERLAKELRRRARARDDARLAKDVDADIEAMRSWLGRELDRRETRGVALFSNAERGYFEAVPLPRSVRDEAALGPTPRVTPILALLDEHERFLVALVDRKRLRLLRFELGEVEELPTLVDVVPRTTDSPDKWGNWVKYTEEAFRAHFRRAADYVAASLARWPTHRVLLGGPDEAVAGVADNLPPAVAAVVAGRVHVRVAAPVKEIVEAALEVEESVERRHEAEAVEELRQRAAGGERAVVGLAATLSALKEGRVDTLLVSEGFAAPGAECPSCGHVGVGTRQCPRCGTTNIEIDDVVEVAVDLAVGQRATVEFCRGGELDRFGRIGALERY